MFRISMPQTKKGELDKLRLLEGQQSDLSESEKKELLNWHPDPFFNGSWSGFAPYLWKDIIAKAHKIQFEELAKRYITSWRHLNEIGLVSGSITFDNLATLSYENRPINFKSGDHWSNIIKILDYDNEYGFDRRITGTKFKYLFDLDNTHLKYRPGF